MTLSFTQQINGKPNLFIDKIWTGLEEIICHGDYSYVPEKISTWEYYRKKHIGMFGKPWEEGFIPDAKIHTIREDKSGRWRAGMDIHFVINNRTPQRFQFAPVIKCKSVQIIEIKVSELNGEPLRCIRVDGRLLVFEEMTRIAINDGFDNIRDFFSYFNKDFTGKIIHWTNRKY
jgi:hypothetical protein